MIRFLSACVLAAVAALPAAARGECCLHGCTHPVARGCQPGYPWHGSYYHPGWGRPLALVIPPTAMRNVEYSNAIPSARMQRVRHQFEPMNAGYAETLGGTGFSPTPRWRTDTTEAGVYYVRGPW